MLVTPMNDGQQEIDALSLGEIAVAIQRCPTDILCAALALKIPVRARLNNVPYYDRAAVEAIRNYDPDPPDLLPNPPLTDAQAINEILYKPDQP